MSKAKAKKKKVASKAKTKAPAKKAKAKSKATSKAKAKATSKPKSKSKSKATSKPKSKATSKATSKPTRPSKSQAPEARKPSAAPSPPELNGRMTLHAAGYEREERMLAGWPVGVTTYRVGDTWICKVDNVSPGAVVARARGATRDAAITAAIERAKPRMGATRRFSIG